MNLNALTFKPKWHKGTISHRIFFLAPLSIFVQIFNFCEEYILRCSQISVQINCKSWDPRNPPYLPRVSFATDHTADRPNAECTSVYKFHFDRTLEFVGLVHIVLEKTYSCQLDRLSPPMKSSHKQLRLQIWQGHSTPSLCSPPHNLD